MCDEGGWICGCTEREMIRHITGGPREGLRMMDWRLEKTTLNVEHAFASTYRSVMNRILHCFYDNQIVD
ncbi:hypothetical protein CEXT_774941 [Caerostris extrusa]|uniref:Uncharacterized protein n=1 Tax=Caerostris extrusa TaxID=172846 RepID=A0AAV4SK12_CAEEX|nr:hypothetical protein CEXT_774941 [Caerostris extrusa]